MKAALVLQDGTVFTGEAHGSVRESVGEVVFNTGMTGYQEVLTDPSYAGQIVLMTYPLIGNYGINTQDDESRRSFVRGFMAREFCAVPSNFRCARTLEDELLAQDVPALTGFDTRALTRKLRMSGVMNGVITTRDPESVDLEQLRAYRVTGAVEEVTCQAAEHFEGTGPRVVLYDFGAKRNITRSLQRRLCDVTVVPAHTPAAEVLAMKPDGIMLSNGPGDPQDCVEIIAQLRLLADSGVPMFGICLGHQLMALAMGFSTGKLKFGHRGSNHPVKDLRLGRTYITSQNHGYAVLADSVASGVGEITHLNLNDDTVEGVRYLDRPIFTVQFHPEASPGPQDTAYLFDRFIALMGGAKNAAQ